jgi:hypothetical protein
MRFDFFTLGGRFFWEDIYNYQNWRIQRHIRTLRYRLIDPNDIRRDSGSFNHCKETLLKYIDAFELDEPYEDTVLIIHNFARTKNSVQYIAEAFDDAKVNVIAVNYASLHNNLYAHAQLLTQFLKNIEIKRHLYIINVGAACLLTRKLLSSSNNYRNYKIARILDVNPINSGSDFCELLASTSFFRALLGPMLSDISTRRAITIPIIPQDIEHGIIFCSSTMKKLTKKILSRFDSFPFLTPPSEQSYAENIKNIPETTFFPLENRDLILNCRQYILTGTFLEDADETENASETDSQ